MPLRTTHSARARNGGARWTATRWLATACAALATLSCGQVPDGPSVLLITLDTTRADRLGCYGHGGDTSPSLDALAARGVRFEHCVAQASVTPVSHASILTGNYPYRHGLRVLHGQLENRLGDSQETLAERFAALGYRTAAFISAFPAGSHFGLHQGYETFDEDFLREPAENLVGASGVVNTGLNQRRADATTDRALDWLSRVEGPFCAWLHYFDPHDWKILPPDSLLAPLERFEGRERLRALYEIEVRYMDAQIGRVLDWLETSGRAASTIVVVTADHGEGLGDHDWWTHGILYEEQIHVPLIVAGPGVPDGVTVPHTVRTIDIGPTLLELAGVPAERYESLDGESLVPVLDGTWSGPPRDGYADSINMLTYNFAVDITDVKNDMLFAIYEGRWKYIHHLLRPDESELYDLAADPGELENLIAGEPDVVRRLRTGIQTRGCIPAQQLTPRRVSREEVERLKSLGYIGR